MSAKGFLDTIVADKRAEVAERRAARPLAEVRAAAREADAPRAFAAAIAPAPSEAPAPRVIAELKARTPTIERFRWSDALDELAEIYRRAGAAALSVVVDAARFGTSLETVSRVRRRVELPVLAKEFVVDAYQVYEARAAGADAILLIARLVDGARLAEFVDLAQELGMAALVETHDEADIDAAVAAGASIVGINNRDLDRMFVDLDVARRLAQRVPPGRIVVAESGIRTRADVDALARAGAHAFLVGGALLDAEDPGALLAELTAPASPGGRHA